MSDLFVIGSSGTRAYRAAMAAISENIANASTPGYARRSVTTLEAGASNATMALYVSRADFGGVQVGGVNRASDPYLDATVRMTGQSLNSANARMRWLGDAETALNDTGTGIGQLMTGFYQNIDKLAASPNDTSLRVTTLDSIRRVADAFRQTATDLEGVSSGIATEAQATISSVNQALSDLAVINNSLLRAQPGTSAYAQLLDSRDSALETVTGSLNLTVNFGAHDSVELSYGGQTIVSGDSATRLAVTARGDGTLALATSTGTALADPSDGSLGGLFAAAQTTSTRRASLDTLALQFATDANAWHMQGRTASNQPGGALLSITAGAATMQALLSDPADLATRSADGTLNGNLLAAGAALRGPGSAEQGWTALIAMHGNLLAATKAEQTTAQGRSDQAIAAREAVSGVDLDLEAAELLRIQQAYSASAKVLQIAKDSVDAIMQIM